VVAAALLAGLVVGGGRLLDRQPAPVSQPQVTSVVFAATTSGGGRPDVAQLADAARVLRMRLEVAGVHGASVQARGGGLLVVVPQEQWREEVATLLAAPGHLELRPVLAVAAAADPRRPFSTVGCSATPPAPAPDKQVVLCQRPPGADNTADADTKLLVGPAALRNDEIAEVYRDQVPPQPERPDAAWQVVLTLTGQGARTFQQLTATAACQPPDSVRRMIAIVLDGSVLEHPPVTTAVRCRQGFPPGTPIALSRLTEQQARTLDALVSSGPLPVRLERQP
jgi:preprotein translocase subunit SecD